MIPSNVAPYLAQDEQRLRLLGEDRSWYASYPALDDNPENDAVVQYPSLDAAIEAVREAIAAGRPPRLIGL